MSVGETAAGRGGEREIPHGPDVSAGGGCAFGTRAVMRNLRPGVRIMLKGFELMPGTDGDPIAFGEVTVESARQALKALSQAIEDAQRGIFR